MLSPEKRAVIASDWRWRSRSYRMPELPLNEWKKSVLTGDVLLFSYLLNFFLQIWIKPTAW